MNKSPNFKKIKKYWKFIIKKESNLYKVNKNITFDRKTICGSNDIYNNDLHILMAFGTDNELVLGQLPVDVKNNEITVMPELVKLLDLEKIINANTLNCKYEIANTIIAKNELYKKAIDKAHRCIKTREYFFYIRHRLYKEKYRYYYNGLIIIGILKKAKENLNTGKVIEKKDII